MVSPLSINTVDDFLQKQTKYQAAFFIVALVVVGLSYAVSTQGVDQVFGLGMMSAEVKAPAFGLGHAPLTTWFQFGILLTLVFGFATYLLCLPIFRCVGNWLVFLRKFGGWVIVLAAMNALSEELIYRGAIVASAAEQLYPWQTALLSAILFSIAHFRGQANGLFVVVGSAVVGWFLAQAVLQTHGLFWAWCVHFIQDTIIFAAFIVSATHPEFNKD